MNFAEALKALAEGKQIYRAKNPEFVLGLQQATVPILTTGLMGSIVPSIAPINDNWLMCKFPLIVKCGSTEFVNGAPYVFSDAEVDATDWEVV